MDCTHLQSKQKEDQLGGVSCFLKPALGVFVPICKDENVGPNGSENQSANDHSNIHETSSEHRGSNGECNDDSQRCKRI